MQALRSRRRRPAPLGAAAALAGVLVAGATLLACGSTPPPSQAAPPATGPVGTRPGGALGAAVGAIEIDDPAATDTTPVPESTSTVATEAPEPSTTTTSTARPAPTTVVTQPPVTQPPVTQPPIPQQPTGGTPSLNARLAGLPDCSGGGTVQVTLTWTGSNLDGVQITGPGVSQSGPASGSASVPHACGTSTRYNLSGSGSGGSASAFVDVSS